MRLKKFLRQWWFIIAYLFLYFLVINVVTVNRFWQFEAYYFDHGIYDQALWNAAHFQAPMIDHAEKVFINQLGDHFTPSMYLLAPLYWLTSSYTALIILENFFVVASAFVLFLIAKDRQIKNLMILALILAYTFFVGLQNAIIFYFHTELPALLTISLTFYFLERKRWRLFFLFLILTLGFKESLPGLGMALGLYLIFKKNFRVGLFTFIFSLIYYFFAIYVAIPYFAGRPFFYALNQYDPVTTVAQFFYPWIKIKTLLVSLATFSFLPLLDIFFLPVILQDYFIRFVMINSPNRTDLGLHYNAVAALLLAYGAILGVTRLKKLAEYRHNENFYGLVVIIFVGFFHLTLHGPLGLVYNPAFYTHTQNLNFLRDFLAKIPNRGLVMTQNNLAVQLTHSHHVMLLRDNYWQWMPDIIAIDIRGGQNPNNYWPVSPSQFDQLYKELSKDPNYESKTVNKQQILFVKKDKVQMDWYPNLKL